MGICRYATLDKSVVQCLIRLLSGVRTYKIMYWRLLRLDCFYDGNGREPGGRIPQVSVIDHQRKLHIHSVLCCCGGRVVEILQHRVCACIHARTYYITELSHMGKLREVRGKLREVKGS